MSKARILYVSQHLVPFLPETPMSSISRHLPQGAHDKGREIRVFMPRFGKINERRHQLHEVIRLSGMNLNVDDVDHPLIIKVASIPTARMQVYFIDNDDLFKRKAVLHDAKDKLFEDSDVRAIFFVRGVLETVRKLGWAPDVIHCHGWMANLLPLYLKSNYADDPYFANSKIVCSIYDEGFEGSLDPRMSEKIALDGINNKNPNMRNFAIRAAVNAPIQGSAADIIKKAMINIDKFLEEKKTKSKMILQVHDELLFEMHESEINYLSMEIKKIMENASLPEVKLDIPLIADIGKGLSWAEAH